MASSDRTTTATLEIRGEKIAGITAFTYSSDVRQLGDPFSVEIPDPRGEYSKSVKRGSLVKLYLENPDVNSGAKTLKLTGRVRKTTQRSRKGQGKTLHVMGADLGWHLTKSCGPLWLNLQRCTYKKLLERVIDPSWGLRGVRAENDQNKRVKLGRPQAALAIKNNALVPIQYIGIGPGEKVADVLVSTFRHAGMLVNVSADGYLQCWNPNYRQHPLYGLEYHGWGSGYDHLRGTRNNAEEVDVEDDADPLATAYSCVWQVLFQDPTKIDPDDPHPGQYHEEYLDDTLPFASLLSFADGDQLSPKAAKRRAEWMARQARYDSWTYRAKVKGHHQGGTWWEADTMCSIDDTENIDHDTGKTIQGDFYVAAVQCSRTMAEGDVTYVTLKRPNLLTAL